MIPLNWKLRPPLSHLGVLMPLNQQVKKAITGLTKVIDPDHQVEIALPLHNRGTAGHVITKGCLKGSPVF